MRRHERMIKESTVPINDQGDQHANSENRSDHEEDQDGVPETNSREAPSTE